MVTVVVGRCGEMRAEREMVPAQVCAWCGWPLTEIDAAWLAEGAPTSHGMCEGCADTVLHCTTDDTWNQPQEPKEAA